MGARISTGPDSKQNYKTPQSFMEAVTNRFGPISFDLAATSDNTQSPNYFAPVTGPEGPMPRDPNAFGLDAFDHPWSYLTTNRFRRDGEMGLAWLNCEFGSIPEWAEKCRDEGQAGANVLLLTPAALGANWFSKFIAAHADVYICKPRIPFIPGKPFNRDCMLSHFVKPSMRSWGRMKVKGLDELDNFRIMEIWNWQTGKTEQRWLVPYPSHEEWKKAESLKIKEAKDEAYTDVINLTRSEKYRMIDASTRLGTSQAHHLTCVANEIGAFGEMIKKTRM
jgi:hypothetical protein